MGAIAEAIVNYAQPLIDQTDGSVEQLNKALAVSQLCYNLALLPEDEQKESLNDLRSDVDMDDEEFALFRRSIIDPMIRRHRELFPRLHRERSTDRFQSGASQSSPSSRMHSGTTTPEKYPGTDRYAPCPCNSGRKYKFCCWARDR